MRSILIRIISVACIIVVLNVVAQCPAKTALTIGEVATKESRCKASGIATVKVSGGVAPYTYNITAGPFIPPVQSTNVFQSLSAGTYTVQVSDQCNKSVSKIFTIAGSYDIPVITSSLVHPKCQDSSGSIAIQINNAGARAPFTYALLAPSPITVPSQAGNIFKKLPAGTYTYRVTDSCGNFQSRTSTLSSLNDNIISIEVKDLIYVSCDSFALPYNLSVKNTTRPYVMIFNLGSKTLTHTLRPTTGTARDTFYFRHRHVTGNLDYYSVSTKDECGRTITIPKNMSILDMEAVSFPKEGCSRDLVYAFDYLRDNSAYRCKPTYYSLMSPEGDVLARQINNSSFSGFPPKRGYKVLRQDCCRKDSIIFEWSEQLPLKMVYSKVPKQSSCKEGTTDINIRTNYSFIGDFIIESGPSHVTFKNGSVHTYSYPDTLKRISFNSTSYISINYFTAGDYKVYVVDDCGRKDGATITISPSELRHSALKAKHVQGCENSHRIDWEVSSNFYGGELKVLELPAYVRKLDAVAADQDSIMNLVSGTYHVVYQYKTVVRSDAYLRNMDTLSCDVEDQTLKIAPYLQPAFRAPVLTMCGKNLNVILQPDSGRGIWPYKYQITSAPHATPLQASNVFSNLSKGTYTFLMSDACGNSYSQNTSIDTLVFPSLNISGNNCAGKSVTLSAALYPFYTYKWQKPNGTSSSGHLITINPLTAADTGIYRVTVTPNIFGCTQSKTQQIKLRFCDVLPVYFISFKAYQKENGIYLSWQTAHDATIAHYILERSIDGQVYESLEKISSNGSGVYQYDDRSVESALVYYRIKAVPFEGIEEYSQIVTVRSQEQTQILIHPNPASSQVQLSWSSALDKGEVEVLDLNGKSLITNTFDPESGHVTVDIEHLAKGIYLLRYYYQGNIETKKLVKR